MKIMQQLFWNRPKTLGEGLKRVVKKSGRVPGYWKSTYNDGKRNIRQYTNGTILVYNNNLYVANRHDSYNALKAYSVRDNSIEPSKKWVDFSIFDNRKILSVNNYVFRTLYEVNNKLKNKSADLFIRNYKRGVEIIHKTNIP